MTPIFDALLLDQPVDGLTFATPPSVPVGPRPDEPVLLRDGVMHGITDAPDEPMVGLRCNRLLTVARDVLVPSSAAVAAGVPACSGCFGGA